MTTEKNSVKLFEWGEIWKTMVNSGFPANLSEARGAFMGAGAGLLLGLGSVALHESQQNAFGQACYEAAVAGEQPTLACTENFEDSFAENFGRDAVTIGSLALMGGSVALGDRMIFRRSPVV